MTALDSKPPEHRPIRALGVEEYRGPHLSGYLAKVVPGTVVSAAEVRG